MKALLLKALLISAGICLLAASAHAYDDTLIKQETKVGGYFDIVSKQTQVKDTFALLIGGKAYLLVNHRWAFGAGGYGVVNDLVPDEFKDRGLTKLRMYYGGWAFEYIPWHDKVFHITLGVLIGAGKVEYKGEMRDPVTGEDSDVFFIAEPEFNLEFNITRFWRMDLGVSYLIASGCQLVDVPDEEISGPAGNLVFKFGSF